MKRVGWILVLSLSATVMATVTFLAVEGLYDTIHRIAFGKASYSTEAIYKVPDTSIEIILERRAIHLFLAEYERTLVVRIGEEEVLRRKVAEDSGGYSRMNVFRITPTQYFLCGKMSFDRHFLDLGEMTLGKAGLIEKSDIGRFVGAFDSDERRKWRFITAFERGEKTIESCLDGGVRVLTDVGRKIDVGRNGDERTY